MSTDEMKQQLDDAIREYAAAKERLKCIDKKLDDFRGAASRATTFASPGGRKRIRADDWKHLLDGEQFASLLDEFSDTKDEISRLGDYLTTRGYGGLVS